MCNLVIQLNKVELPSKHIECFGIIWAPSEPYEIVSPSYIWLYVSYKKFHALRRKTCLVASKVNFDGVGMSKASHCDRPHDAFQMVVVLHQVSNLYSSLPHLTQHLPLFLWNLAIVFINRFHKVVPAIVTLSIPTHTDARGTTGSLPPSSCQI